MILSESAHKIWQIIYQNLFIVQANQRRKPELTNLQKQMGKPYTKFDLEKKCCTQLRIMNWIYLAV